MGEKKKSMNKEHWQRCELKGTLIHCWWECKLVKPLGKNSGEVSEQTENRTTV